RRLKELADWTWDPVADQWEEGFNKLLAYVDQNGHARVPASYKLEGLGAWVGLQRRNYAKGNLDADRERRLKELPGWSWDPYADQWEESFNKLLLYVEHNGHARVPPSYRIDGFRLGSWVSGQRGSHNKGNLDADRERRLKELPGWSWDPGADRWEQGFNKLSLYVEHNGDARVPFSCKFDGYALGNWVATQRRFYSTGRLDADRQKRLRGLPGWTWDARPSS
ncbi:helicase associated domain-containing protein, partial [Mycobacterium sp.]|uniref:helicase associated domain-containing protein n=1 Tax=Mycobacterium sp. TaxID=1785 RepID=UPI003BB0936F